MGEGSTIWKVLLRGDSKGNEREGPPVKFD